MIEPLNTDKTRLKYDPELGVVSNPDHDIFNTNVYHGVRSASGAASILDSGSIKSIKRREVENQDDQSREDEADFIEDVLRFNEGEPEGSLDLMDYAEENREFLREEGSEGTNRFINGPIEVYNITGSKLQDRGAYDPLRRFCVSVGDEITSHVSSRVSNGGAAFELSIPSSTIINPGIAGNIPGEIPLDYATSIYYDSDMSEQDVSRLEQHGAVEKHGISVEPVENYWQSSELFDY